MNCSGWPFEDVDGSVAAAIEGRGTDGGGGALQIGTMAGWYCATTLASVPDTSVQHCSWDEFK